MKGSETILTHEDEIINSFVQSLKVSGVNLIEVPVTFGNLGEEEVSKILDNVKSKWGEERWKNIVGVVHASKPTISGKLQGNGFVSLKNLECIDGFNGQTVYTMNGNDYTIKIKEGDPNRGSYEEHLTLADGTKTSFATGIDVNGVSVYSRISKNGISLVEEAALLILDMHLLENGNSFVEFAQPSDELLVEYSKTTGLPIIKDTYKIYDDNELKVTIGANVKGLYEATSEQDSRGFPYIVAIEVRKEEDGENQPRKKAISYVYTSLEAYKNGEKPYMIYMDGIDRRTGPSGMFRLKGNSYIDNKTFRKEGEEYKVDTISYEEIMNLAGRMPTQLSERANLAVIGGELRIPSELKEIYNRAISIEKNAVVQTPIDH